MRYISVYEALKNTMVTQEELQILNEFQQYIFDFVTNMLNVYVLSGKDKCVHIVDERNKTKNTQYHAEFRINEFTAGVGLISFTEHITNQIKPDSFYMVLSNDDNEAFAHIIEFFELKTRIVVRKRKRIAYTIHVSEIKKFLSEITDKEFEKYMATSRFDL